MSNDYARQMVTAAISKGFIPPAYEHDCVDCGKQAEDYDHRDYNKPLEVDPVCHHCNMKRGKGKAFSPVVATREKPKKASPPEKNNIRAYRNQAGISQVRFAEMLGVSQGCISGWETGRTEPSINHVRMILAVFRSHDIEASFEDIFGDTAA